MNNKNTLCSWSGGKDSCYALMQVKQQGYNPKVLLNILNEGGKISRSHGIPGEILQAQAKAAQLPIELVSSSWQDYQPNFIAALTKLKEEHSVDYAVFGDIDLQAHRDWEEMVCANAGLKAILPLWQQDRKQLVMDMLATRIVTMIVSCNTTMGERFLGKVITPALVEELEALGIDPCGENGEFHTLVLDCPMFNKPISVTVKGNLLNQDYWFTNLVLNK